MLSFFKKSKAPCIYSEECQSRRLADIPDLESLGGRSKKIEFDQTGTFNFEKKTKIVIPPSIEYSKSKKKDKEVPVQEEIVEEDVKRDDMLVSDLLMDKDRVDPDIVDLSHIPKANEEKIRELEVKHMNFYSLLSSIQETHVASDFRSAYDIQDKIAYLLNNRDLLFDSLVDKLLFYLDSIVSKLGEYKEDIDKKHAKFKSYNKSISDLKEYKYKTDESLKIIYENLDLVNQEKEKNEKALKLNSI